MKPERNARSNVFFRMNKTGEKLGAPTYLEAASAAKLRGLPVPHTWEEIESFARQLAFQCAEADFATRARCAQLVAAARALDAVAQGAPAGGVVARERGVWAGAAYAVGGNFPGASVVVARTFPRARASDAATATLLCALSPSLRFDLRAQTPLASALDALFAGENCDVLSAFDAIENTVWAPELWRLARAGLEAVAQSATIRALQNATLPDGFAASLSAHIPTLLPPQLDAIRGGLLGGQNALAALPPGTGKTLLGELFLASALGRGAGLAVFLVPYVSLGRGVAASLRAHCPGEIPVHRWLGGHGTGGEKSRADERAEFAVMTPERFDALLRARPELWNQLRGVVIDEAHALGEGARGARIEGLIARLRAHQKNGGRTRLMLLSAALDERAQLESWAAIERVFASSWTPTARRLAFWRQDGRLEWHAELAGGASKSLGEIGLAWPHHINNGGDGWARVRRLEPLAWQNVAHLARQLHDERGGAILCLCSTRRATRELGRALGELWDEALHVGGALARCIESIEARHRTLLPLAGLLKCGVAWHNSSLPPEVRDALEEAIADGQIHAVAATTTLAEGVDLPFAQTIVADWLKWDENGQAPISSALFRNIAGRCGRAGAFTEGDTLVFDHPLGPSQFTAVEVRRDLQRAQFVGAVLAQPRSALANATAELARAEISANSALETDARRAKIGAARDGATAALESQLLALAREQPQLAPCELASQFYASRFDSDFASRVARIWAGFERDGLIENGVLSALGAAIARTDWSPASALRLLGALQSLPACAFENASDMARLNAYLWRALGAAPEAGGEIERFFGARSRLVARPEHLEPIGRDWLAGVAPEAMFANLPRAQKLDGIGVWLEREDAPPDRAATSPASVPIWNGEFDRWLDFSRAGLESWTPWLWRTAAILAPLAGNRAAKIQWQSWANRWELGVDSAWAASALRAGAPGTRTTCALVGRHWPFVSAQPSLDPLALSPLRDQRATAQNAIDAALREAGGAHCFAGRNVLALRDWLWARAGESK